jgi:L-ribulokinase
MEAGQSAFGDAYAWFRKVLPCPFHRILQESALIDPATAKRIADETSAKMIDALSKQAAQLPMAEDNELAIDWFNGRRTPDANQSLTGAISGLDLGSDAPEIFRAIVESTCFGAKAIVDRFNEEGIPVRGLIGLGGVAKKSPFIMQMLADVINMPIRIHRSEQTCAHGAAMFAATAAGIFDRVEEAMAAMGQGFDATFIPDKANADRYSKRYSKYRELGKFMESMTVSL